MLCKNCGASLEEGTKICPICSQPVDSPVGSPTATQGAPVETQSGTTAEGTVNRCRLLKILLLIGMICFFLPFVTVSCSAQTIDISGMDAMLANEAVSGELDMNECPMNPYLLAAFALGIVGIVIVWMNRKLIIAACTSLIGAFALLLFRTTFISFYELNEYAGMLDIQFRFGWFLSLAAYLASAIIAFLPLQTQEGKETPGQYDPSGAYQANSGDEPQK